jgi:hypothetical protein
LPERPPWFAEVAHERGIGFDHRSGHASDRFLYPEIVCGGGAFIDLENDGDLDVFIAQSGSLVGDHAVPPGHRLYRNRGDGTFDDVTAGSGVDVPGYGMGTATGDFDNDGLADLYITNVGPNALLRNNGDGTFTDVTTRAAVGHGGFGSSCAFVDVDADGDLDLFVVNYIHWSAAGERDCYTAAGQRDYCAPSFYGAPARDVLYRNNGDGTFTDVSIEAGLDAAYGNGLGVVCGDFNEDGRIDIFVANDKSPNQLWINSSRGAAIRFTDEAMQRGCAVDDAGLAKAGMGAHAADLDGDGRLDLLVVNIQTETDSLFRNAGSYFVDHTAAAGLGVISRGFTRFGAALVDLDNDGHLDLYEANGGVRLPLAPPAAGDPYAEVNLLFRGREGGRFEEVRSRGGTQVPLIATSRAAAFGDIDNDGGVDVLVVNRDGPAHLLRNVVPGRGHWLLLSVIDEHGRDAIGAVVTMLVAGRSVGRDVRTAYSYLAANDPRVHVGLGAATAVSDVSVRWVDGAVESFGDLPADRVEKLRRGAGRDVAGGSRESSPEWGRRPSTGGSNRP